MTLTLTHDHDGVSVGWGSRRVYKTLTACQSSSCLLDHGWKSKIVKSQLSYLPNTVTMDTASISPDRSQVTVTYFLYFQTIFAIKTWSQSNKCSLSYNVTGLQSYYRFTSCCIQEVNYMYLQESIPLRQPSINLITKREARFGP